ncbi:acetylornithine deacetylase/succinyl-diaminopimelate desuccinylase-like protein [Pseudoxanthomonas sp. 3HH-4]|uniref:M20/M25/M40 family metallo-hydrolase n=1 Tax=Pseudoxanthomonas sp. 3HH-4 TaxID=1690214 RepID=UPI00115027BA|nr:M20/M25/M40 family metallo-hydrolase [Pseudoxanthomonas sp. 3HH-4]TQM10351.1 acetylornithine deacetylase/succinyl-diaminopimelate desuccinylase-like protein [Pseudoxanthomonas sp. 3HH-4]
MDLSALQDFIEDLWSSHVMPTLMSYIAIPCESPAFDPAWEANGYMERAVELMAAWSRDQLTAIPGASIEVVRLDSRTPVIFIEIPGDECVPVLLYGHLDKQPPMEGWTHGRSAWVPSLEGDRLYGRGGADDGYALFSAITALRALHAQGIALPRCTILIEACEESGSGDLPFHVAHLADRIGTPALVVALDAGCGNYDQLWLTTSLRGQVGGTLTVLVLDEGIHSGDGSGVVPSSFRVARRLLSRLECEDSGEVTEQFHAPIPAPSRLQAESAAQALGTGFYEQLPLAHGVSPVSQDVAELILNRAWRPQLAVLGIDGLPAVAQAPAVTQPSTSLKIALRLPPTVDPLAATAVLKTLLETDPPYGAHVVFQPQLQSKGWLAPTLSVWLERSVQEASMAAFGAPSASIGGGGGIPFLSMLGERFPDAQFVVTGVLGPQSNAHGPNEFLHVPTAIRLTVAMALILRDTQRHAASSANTIPHQPDHQP